MSAPIDRQPQNVAPRTDHARRNDDALRADYADVRRAYAELGDEQVPPALDAAVLQAARAAVRPARTRSRWVVPASLAASVVLAVGIALDVRREARHEAASESAVLPTRPAAEAVGPVAAEAAADAVVPSVAQRPLLAGSTDATSNREAMKREQAGAAPDVALATPAREAGLGASERSAPAAEATVATPPVAMSAPAPAGPDAGAAPVAAPALAADAALVAVPAPAPPPATSGATAAGDEPASAERGVAQHAGESAAPGPTATRTAPGTTRAKAEEDPADRRFMAPPPAPEAWLARIDALRRDGRTAEADAEFARFVQAYPDHPRARAPR